MANPKRICLFFDRTYVDAHPCFREMVLGFLRYGWGVDLFMDYSPTQTSICLPDQRLKVFFIHRTQVGVIKFFLRILFGKRFHAIVATPPWALYWAVCAGFFRRIPVVCLSDEIYSWHQILTLTGNKINPALLSWDRKERWAHQQSVMTISLSEERFNLVKKKNSLSNDHPHTVIPNAPAGPADRVKTSFYRETLNVPPDATLLLHSGSFDWSFAKALLEMTPQWGDRIHLVFQLRLKAQQNGFIPPKNVKFSQAVLPGELMRYATSSADIGLLLYNRDNFIESINGATAGKLALYLSCGLPIICSNLDSLKWIEKEKCGIWLPDLSSVDKAALQIMSHYEEFSRNAVRIFNEKYDYSKYFDIFMNKLTSMISSG